MATDIRIEKLQLTAGADLAESAQYKALTFAGTVAADAPNAAGILITAPVSSGQAVSVGYTGAFKADFGAAVSTPGFPLTVAASGWIVAAGSLGFIGCIGRAITTVASGDRALAFFNFTDI